MKPETPTKIELKMQIEKLQQELNEAREHLSEALAGRDQWRKTHLKLADAKAELDAAHRGAVGLNLRIAELHGQIADAKVQIADYEAALEFIAYNVLGDAKLEAIETLNKWSKK